MRPSDPREARVQPDPEPSGAFLFSWDTRFPHSPLEDPKEVPAGALGRGTSVVADGWPWDGPGEPWARVGGRKQIARGSVREPRRWGVGPGQAVREHRAVPGSPADTWGLVPEPGSQSADHRTVGPGEAVRLMPPCTASSFPSPSLPRLPDEVVTLPSLQRLLQMLKTHYFKLLEMLRSEVGV